VAVLLSGGAALGTPPADEAPALQLGATDEEQSHTNEHGVPSSK
jgi:hypothetical protein